MPVIIKITVENYNVEQLKQAIVLEWCALSQRFKTDDSIDQWASAVVCRTRE